MEPDDEVGHGTGCAGIIGARGSGIPRGLGGDATVLPLRVLGSASMPGKEERVGVGALPDIDDGLKRAIDLRAVVLNLSFGTPLDTLDEHDPVPHLDVVRYGLARGCVMVAASGNSGRAERFSPACLEGVIAVGSVNDEGRQSPFSTRGEHVAISAPGERVVSAGLGGVARLTGTSFAAPFVTATAALLLARANKRSVPLDAARVRQLLRASARPFTGPALDGYGAGILDAAAALRALDAEFDGQTPPQQSLA
jgi:subtilisin family serine protease